jgi:TolB-like protein/Tfp pilus assembly protein PilF
MAEEVIALDPEYPEGYSLLAYTHYMDVWFRSGKSPKDSFSRAYELAQKVIAMDDSSVMAHILLGHLYLLKRQHEKAIAETERAITLSPNSASGYAGLGRALNYAGRPEEAIPLLKKAIRLDPLPKSFFLYTIGVAYNMTGRYDESIEACKKAIKDEPNSLYAHVVLAAAYSLSGQEEEAHAETEEVLKIHPKFSLEYFGKTAPYKNPADRENFIAALRKAGIPEKPPLPLPDRPSIAVLPFVNMSGDPEQEYFSDGITEEIITALSKTPKMFVIARNSTFTYKGKPVKVQQVGRELGVKYVLEGSVRKAEDKVRITAQLVDAQTGHQLWAERYDRDLKDIFELQDEITKNIITALNVQLTEGEQARLSAKGTANLNAYLKASRAWWYNLQSTRDGVLKAKRLSEEAIALDPNYAFAYMTLGASHGISIFLGMSKSPGESLKRAIELSQKAIALDDSLGQAHVALGYWLSMARQYDKAIAEGQRAMALEPSSADVIYNYAAILCYAGRFEEAIPLLKEALRLNPMPPNSYYRHFGLALREAGHYEEAIAITKKAIEKEPDDLLSHVGMAVHYTYAGRMDEARAAAREVLRLNRNFSADQFGKVLPMKDPAVTARIVGSLKKAGLK